jgi:hypothetical protein
MRTHGQALAYVCSLGWSLARMHARRTTVPAVIQSADRSMDLKREQTDLAGVLWYLCVRLPSTVQGIMDYSQGESFSPLPQLQYKCMPPACLLRRGLRPLHTRTGPRRENDKKLSHIC